MEFHRSCPISLRIGFKRIWVTGHDGDGTIAGRVTEALIAAIAAHRSHIRVVLVRFCSINTVHLKWPKSCTLNDFFPDALILGVGRATTGTITDLAFTAG